MCVNACRDAASASLSGLLGVILAVLPGSHVSALLSCVTRTTCGPPNATACAPGAVPSVAQKYAKIRFTGSRDASGAGLPGILDNFLAILPGPWVSVPTLLACRTPVGHQMDATWTPSGLRVNFKLGCQVELPQRLPVSTYFLRAPKQLPRPTQLLAISTPLPMDIDGNMLVYKIYIYIYDLLKKL